MKGDYTTIHFLKYIKMITIDISDDGFISNFFILFFNIFIMNTYNILKLYKNKCLTPAPDILEIRSKEVKTLQCFSW